MRISDWSSDVCSSDLHSAKHRNGMTGGQMACQRSHDGDPHRPGAEQDADISVGIAHDLLEVERHRNEGRHLRGKGKGRSANRITTRSDSQHINGNKGRDLVARMAQHQSGKVYGSEKRSKAKQKYGSDENI